MSEAATKQAMRSDKHPFDWSGGHPALHLVNTLDERPSPAPVETLGTYRDLVRFVEVAELIEPGLARRLRRFGGPACDRVLKRTRRVREHVHDVLLSAHLGRPARGSDIAAISAAVQAAHAARKLAASTRSLTSQGWQPPASEAIPLHACALAIEQLLTEVDRRILRKCAASDCNVFYIDTSKGRRRQWCDMSNCGNRTKQRRWRSRTAKMQFRCMIIP